MVMAPARSGDFSVAPSPPLVGSPTVGQPPIDPNMQGGIVPFRMATLERSENVGQTGPIALVSAEQVVDTTLPGSGFLYGADLFVQGVTSGNSATVVFHEDAPFSALSSIMLRDVNGILCDLDGFSLEMAARYGGWRRYLGVSSSDTALWALTAGGGGTGGSFTFHAMLPIVLNRRTLVGLLGNQDRAQLYALRHNLASSAAAASGPIYTTAPTTPPNVTLTRLLETYVIPNAINDNGRPNQIVPAHYGTLPYLTRSLSDAAPLGGSQVSHYLRRIGNVIRTVILIFRSNGSRATAEANMPTAIQFKIGNETIFIEPYQYRRHLMYQRYGFDAPSGVLVYDFIHDFSNFAGFEFGNDWLWSQNLSQVQFIISYPSGFGSTNNSLVFVTSDMIVPPGANVYGL